ncbi:MAG: DUF1566 domain-containing protein [Desulfobacterales bacterium]
MGLLLDTDQCRCYDALGTEQDCRGSGQDAEFGAGKRDPGLRFFLEGEIVRDRWTGLRWPRNANLAEFPLTWKEAQAYVESADAAALGGIREWRLPTRGELFSLVSHQQVNPALPAGHPFENVFPGYYWTGTPCARLPKEAWYIHLGGGRVQRGMKHGSYMIWPVAGPRNPASPAEGRLRPNGELVVDGLTQRVWLNPAELPGDPLIWSAALQLIKDLNDRRKAGFSDWRLPNIRELASLVDSAKHSPALAAGCAFARLGEGYWSSTTSVYDPCYAWVLYPRDGAIGVGFKPQADFHLFAVRSDT